MPQPSGTMAVREMRDVNSDGILESIATYFSGMYNRDDTNGTLRWYIYDGLGSVLAEVDPSGNVTAGRKYDVYGLVRSGQAGISKHKFVGKLGHPSEDETGLIYMRARYMDPVLGKFVSEDPAGDGANWYMYCYDNPVNFGDRSGKNPYGLGGLDVLDWTILYLQFGLVCEFDIFAHSGVGIIDIENAYGNLTRRLDATNAAADALTTASIFGAVCSGSIPGAIKCYLALVSLTGARFAITVLAYSIRLEYYLDISE